MGKFPLIPAGTSGFKEYVFISAVRNTYTRIVSVDKKDVKVYLSGDNPTFKYISVSFSGSTSLSITAAKQCKVFYGANYKSSGEFVKSGILDVSPGDTIFSGSIDSNYGLNVFFVGVY